MQNFKEYLTEARDYPIYHCTMLSKILKIVDEGLLPNTAHFHKKLLLPMHKKLLLPKDKANRFQNNDIANYSGISTTRDFNFAYKWCFEDSAIIELDHMRIANTFKILPVQFARGQARYQNPDRNEYEEFIVTNKPIPFNKTFVKCLWLNNNSEKAHELSDTKHLNYVRVRFYDKGKKLND